MAYREPARDESASDEGFILIAAVVMIFMVLLALSVAAPTIAKSIQHDREMESAHRAQQYVRAIRVFYIKNKRYPTTIEQLEKTNNVRYLRQRYVDPLTGKPDWRVIHVGENQTTVKGFFGEDLPGLAAMQGGGLGSASSLSSTTGGGVAGAGSTSAFGGSSTPGTGASGLGGSGTATGTGTGLGGTGTSAFGSTSGTSQTGSAGGTGSNTNGIASQDATTFTGGGGAPIMGLGSARSGEAMLVVNEQNSYETWEFLYDPRIEALYAKATLLGGIASASATGSTSGFGTPVGTPIGTTPGGTTGGGTTPSGGTNPLGGTTPQ